MKQIDAEGEYIVQIREPRWESAGKDGETKMSLVLPGYCMIGDEECHINGYLYFTPTLIKGGRNAGKPMYEVNAQLCLDLGMTAPFEPHKRTELDGVEARFVVSEEEYEGKKRMRVAFVNPPGRAQLTDDDAAAVWAKLTGGKAVVTTVVEGQEKPDPFAGESKKDTLPF